jgi:hypothetical protein
VARRLPVRAAGQQGFMSTQSILLLLFAGVVGVLLTTILLKVSKLRGSPHLAFATEQTVDFEHGGSYALWLTGGPRGFWVRRLTEVYPKIRLIEASTGGEVAITYPLFPPMIRGFGSYRQFATFSVERPGRYTLRIISPKTQTAGASAARLILERRRGQTIAGSG